MSLGTDLKDFIDEHRPHGIMTAAAAPPSVNGYLLNRRLLVWCHL
jgi:hypothetical protein